MARLTYRQLRSLIVEQARVIEEAGHANRASSVPAPHDMARRLMTATAVDHAYAQVGPSGDDEAVVAAAVQYVLDTNVAARDRARLGARYMAGLEAALAIAARGFL